MDSATQLPIPNSNVKIIKSNKEYLTKNSGKITINLSKEHLKATDFLLISHVLYQKKIISIKDIIKDNLIMLLPKYRQISEIIIKKEAKYFTINKLKKRIHILYPIAGNFNFRKKYYPLYCSDKYAKLFDNYNWGDFMEEAVFISNNKEIKGYISKIRFYLGNKLFLGEKENKLIFNFKIYQPKKINREQYQCSISQYVPGKLIYSKRDTQYFYAKYSIINGVKIMDTLKSSKRNYKLIEYLFEDTIIKFSKAGIFISIELLNCNDFGECSLFDSIKGRKNIIAPSASPFFSSFTQGSDYKLKLSKAIPVFIKNKRTGRWTDITFEKLYTYRLGFSKAQKKELKSLKKNNIEKYIIKFNEFRDNFFDNLYKDKKLLLKSNYEFWYPLYELTISY